jgi:hypothetical protein
MNNQANSYELLGSTDYATLGLTPQSKKAAQAAESACLLWFF